VPKWFVKCGCEIEWFKEVALLVLTSAVGNLVGMHGLSSMVIL